MADIRLLTLADRPLVSEFLHDHPPIISEQTFTNLFIWQPSRPVFVTEIDNSLIFLVKSADIEGAYILYGPPAGAVAIPEIFAALDDRLTGAVRIPEENIKEIPAEIFIINADRDNADYVYRVSDLAELNGRRYAKKRNKIKQCLKNHTCEYIPITPDLIKECEDMQENWCSARDCGRNPGLCNEANAIAETFAHFRSFGLIGGAVRVNGEIQAYAIAEELHPGTAVWHFEKAMAHIPGLGQLINHWFSRYGLTDFEYVNREQDLGVPGLRQAKKSYFPHHMVEKSCISLSEDRLVTTKSIKAAGCAEYEH